MNRGFGTPQVANYSWGYQEGKAADPLPFVGAGTADLHGLVDEAPQNVVRLQLTRLDGLRLALVEFISNEATSITPPGPLHEVWYASAINSQTQSNIRIALFCAPARWNVDRATLEAIARSVRFSRPRG
jgi:hypothetical protein